MLEIQGLPNPALHSTPSPPINDTAPARFLTLAGVKLLRRFRPRAGRVLLISRKLCIKYGAPVDLAEASTLRFIAQHTSIPVPKVLCAFVHRGRTYIVMERIDGEYLGKTWVQRSSESKARILDQLKNMIQEMRKLLPPKEAHVANVDGGPFYDARLPGPSMRFGPFETVDDFHKHLRNGVEHRPGLNPEVRKLITLHKQHWPLVFTHGDLSSLNILFRGDNVVGIVDWETAGWFPAYWEYTTASQVNPQNSFWGNEVDHFLDPYPSELAMEKIRQEYFGDF